MANKTKTNKTNIASVVLQNYQSIKRNAHCKWLRAGEGNPLKACLVPVRFATAAVHAH